MNRYLNIGIAMVLALLSGCRDHKIIFLGPYHVRFTEEATTVKESFSEIVDIPIHLVGPQTNERIDIQYQISGTAVEGKDFEFISQKGHVVIQPENSFGYIRLRTINNSNNILSSQDLIMELTSVSPSRYEVGRGDGIRIGARHIFTIEDDCILSGRYTSVALDNAFVFTDIEISSGDCITYRLSNWDMNIPQLDFAQVRDLLFKDNGDNTLEIPQQEEQTLPSELATIRGDGFVNPTTREITFNIELVDFEDSPVITLKYTPK